MSVTAEKLCRSFGERTVLRDVSFTLPERGLCLLTGPSGCGKTTLLRILAGLDKGYTGRITGAKTVSMCFQEYRLFPGLSALKNVTETAFPRAGAEEIRLAGKMLTDLGFEESQLELRPGQLSGGMRQRVSLARALCAPAELVLLDEPLKELDAALRRRALELIRRRAQECPVVLSVHEEDEIPGEAAMRIRLGQEP